jgi:hypothetical protein
MLSFFRNLRNTVKNTGKAVGRSIESTATRLNPLLSEENKAKKVQNIRNRYRYGDKITLERIYAECGQKGLIDMPKAPTPKAFVVNITKKEENRKYNKNGKTQEDYESEFKNAQEQYEANLASWYPEYKEQFCKKDFKQGPGPLAGTNNTAPVTRRNRRNHRSTRRARRERRH